VAFPTRSQVRTAVPETWARGGTHGTLLQTPACLQSRPQNLPVWPQTKGGANLHCVWGSCCSQEGARSGAFFWLSEGVEAAAQHRGASRAMQPACTFSWFVLKYPLVSFFTSYSLYPKLCISPLNGVIFLIAGRVLLLDTSLLLMRCVALRRAQRTYLILQTGEDESSCSSAANAHPKMCLLPVRLVAETPLEGKSHLKASLRPHYPTERRGSAVRWVAVGSTGCLLPVQRNVSPITGQI